MGIPKILVSYLASARETLSAGYPPSPAHEHAVREVIRCLLDTLGPVKAAPENVVLLSDYRRRK